MANKNNDKRVKNQLKYVGEEKRIVFLKHKNFVVNKGDTFGVSASELLSFKDKEQFKQVK